MRTIVHTGLLLCSVGVVLCTERPVFPALGEPLASIERDQRILQATQTVQQERAFTIHILTGPGAVVREYASPAGVVFALAWHHRTGLLDLEALFGPYYQEYAQAMSMQGPEARQSSRMTTEHLIVERRGRMGAASGRVLVIPLLPPGLSQDQIQ